MINSTEPSFALDVSRFDGTVPYSSSPTTCFLDWANPPVVKSCSRSTKFTPLIHISLRFSFYTLHPAIYVQGFALVAPALHFWYLSLSKLVTASGMTGVVFRLLLDQSVFAPAFIAVFFTALLTLEVCFNLL